ncbi:hypothetical protein SMICM304S_02840 [Streptomyces microflavus]
MARRSARASWTVARRRHRTRRRRRLRPRPRPHRRNRLILRRAIRPRSRRAIRPRRRRENRHRSLQRIQPHLLRAILTHAPARRSGHVAAEGIRHRSNGSSRASSCAIRPRPPPPPPPPVPPPPPPAGRASAVLSGRAAPPVRPPPPTRRGLGSRPRSPLPTGVRCSGAPAGSRFRRCRRRLPGAGCRRGRRPRPCRGPARAGRRCRGPGRCPRCSARAARLVSFSTLTRASEAVPGGRRPGGGARRAGRWSCAVRRWRGRSGRSDADGVQAVGAGLLHDPLDQRHRLLDGGPGTGVVPDGHGRLGEHPADQVGHEHGDALRAHVQGRQLGAAGDDAVQPGVRAASRAASRLADDLDQAGGGEAFDEVGDRRPGQAGELLQLPGRQWTFVLQQPQVSWLLMARAVLGMRACRGILPRAPDDGS